MNDGSGKHVRPGRKRLGTSV